MDKLIVIAGKPRQGKSKFSKDLLVMPNTINTPCLVWDAQNEYGDSYFTNIDGKRTEVKGIGLKPYSKTEKRARFLPTQGTTDDFIRIAGACRGRIIVFEEATIFLKGGISEALRKIVVSKFHTQCYLVFVFHRLNTVPKDIIDLANYLILFKTADNAKDIDTRYKNETITKALMMQQKKQDGAKPTIVNVYEDLINNKPISSFKNHTLFQ